MKKLKKLLNNILSIQAIRVLGFRNYCRYLFSFILKLRQILNEKSLKSLDKSFSSVKQFSFKTRKFYFDCAFCDKYLKEDSFGFGVAREIYIRDCYFKHFPENIYPKIRSAIDVGANRGAFSSLMTPVANKLIIIEGQSQYLPIIEHNMAINNFGNYNLKIGFVGGGGLKLDSVISKLSITDLLDENNLDNVDFIKIDIEGNEKLLFEEISWLKRVDNIAMEVHPEFVDPLHICTVLKLNKFKIVSADENLKICQKSSDINFIYAWK